MGIRYSKVEGKFQREIVLLKSFPYAYGKCSFCNYIEDNSTDEGEINRINLEVLEEIKWFVQDMKYLFNDDRIGNLIDNKDLGVFEQ